jgi:Tol biopolymer transport system component
MLKSLSRICALLIGAAVISSCSTNTPKRIDNNAKVIAFTKITATKLDSISSIWIANANGQHARALTRGGGPTVSPNGRWITYWRSFAASYGAPLYLLDRKTGETRIIRRHVYSPVLWASDSRKLALNIAVGTGLKTKVELVDPNTGRGDVVVTGDIGGFALSRDGRWVAYDAVANESRNYPAIDLFAIRSTGGKSIRLTEDGLSRDPVWGAKSISYVRMTEKHTWPTEVWGLRFTGEKNPSSRRLSDHVGSFTPGAHWEPIDWWPDGRHLLVGVNPDQHGYYAFYKLDTVTRRLREIVKTKDLMMSAQLSRDGKLALITYGDGSIAIVLTSNGRVVRHVGRGDSAVWNR